MAGKNEVKTLSGEDFLSFLPLLKIDLANPEPEPEDVLSSGGNIFASPGNILVVKAPSKAGKSTIIAVIVAAFISHKTILGIKGNPIDGRRKCIILDSEQSKSHVHKMTRKIHRLADLSTDQNNPLLEVYYLKELDTNQRLKVLGEVMKDREIGLIVVDGIIDFIHDFNDITESTALRDELQKIVAENNTVLISVIHTNKRDNNSRGHIGAMLEQKSETTLQLTKDGSIFNVVPAYTRNAPIDEFSFIINGEGMPEPFDQQADRQLIGRLKRKKDFSHVLSGQSLLTYQQLVDDYREYTGTAERTAKLHIKEAIDSSTIVKHPTSGKYSLSLKQINNEDND